MENQILLAADFSERGILGGYVNGGTFYQTSFFQYPCEKGNFSDCILSALENALAFTERAVRRVYPQTEPYLLALAVTVFGKYLCITT